jgi:protein involved in polysaccharide export with SLBB domain
MTTNPSSFESTEPISDIRVYVTGAVNAPGVYPLTEDSRWADAVQTAGGFAPDANPEAINLSRRVQAEDQSSSLASAPQPSQALTAVTSSTSTPHPKSS